MVDGRLLGTLDTALDHMGGECVCVGNYLQFQEKQWLKYCELSLQLSILTATFNISIVYLKVKTIDPVTTHQTLSCKINSQSNICSTLCAVEYSYSLPIILGDLVLTHEGIKICIFLYTSICKMCIWYVSVKNCLADAFFGRFTQHFTCSVKWKRNIWGIEIFSIRSLRGVGLSRENVSFLGSSHFNN